MEYKPGDVVNGHIFGADRVWHPVPLHEPTMPRPGYWRRYGKRWPKTGLIAGVVTALGFLSILLSEPRSVSYSTADAVAYAMSFTRATIIGFLVCGTLLNFVVAIFPARKSAVSRFGSLGTSMESVHVDRVSASRRSFAWIGAVAAVCAIGFVGFLAVAHYSDSPSGVSRAGDTEQMEEFGTYASEWNETLAPVVAHYLDPNVDTQAWIEEAGPVIGELEPMIRAMGDIASELVEADLRFHVTGLVENYQFKLEAFSQLVNAVASGDADATETAELSLHAASYQGTLRAKEMMDFLKQ